MDRASLGVNQYMHGFGLSAMSYNNFTGVLQPSLSFPDRPAFWAQLAIKLFASTGFCSAAPAGSCLHSSPVPRHARAAGPRFSSGQLEASAAAASLDSAKR